MKLINLLHWTLLLSPVAAAAHPGHADGGGFAETGIWVISAALYLLLLLLMIRGRVRRGRHKR